MSWHELHDTTMGLVQGALFTGLITDVGKRFAGRYRPYYLTQCTELDASHQCVGGNMDGRYSFPSGHTSFMCFGMLYLSLWLCAKLKLYHGARAFWKAIVVFIPILASWLVGITRTRDYHHHFSDVVAGAIIGYGCAWFVYFLHFPVLSDPACNYPLQKDGREGFIFINDVAPFSSKRVNATDDINSDDGRDV